MVPLVLSRRITNSFSPSVPVVLPGTRKIAEFQARMDEPWLFGFWQMAALLMVNFDIH